ncbi:hypothetical protein [Corynebacterium sp. c7Ub_26]
MSTCVTPRRLSATGTTPGQHDERLAVAGYLCVGLVGKHRRLHPRETTGQPAWSNTVAPTPYTSVIIPRVITRGGSPWLCGRPSLRATMWSQ